MKAVAIAIVLALVPAFMFAQGVSEPAKAGVSCPEAECHTAPFFQGSGGFVGQIDPEVMVEGEPITEVSFVVSCGNVTIRHSVAPDADGKIAQLFTDDNGLACNESGEIEIHGLMDGAWYWIHDDMNSAVEQLLPKSVLMNDKTPPFDASGGSVTMTEGPGGYASLVKDTASGRVGILSHILPVPPAPAAPETPGCSDTVRKDCLLTGEYAVVITNADDVSVVDDTITRGADGIELTASIGGTGNITADSTVDVTANFDIGGPGDTVVPASYGEDQDQTGVTSVTWTIPAADATALANSADPCATSNQQRDAPITVVVTLDTSANTIPGFTADDGPSAMFSVACPAVAGAAGVELVPENPFPVE